MTFLCFKIRFAMRYFILKYFYVQEKNFFVNFDCLRATKLQKFVIPTS